LNAAQLQHGIATMLHTTAPHFLAHLWDWASLVPQFWCRSDENVDGAFAVIDP
jgi:hypothetical protein